MVRRKIKLILGKAFQKLKDPITIGDRFKLVSVELTEFPNQESRVWIMNELKGDEVFILSPTRTNDDIIELALLTDAAKRLGAKKVTAVTPWLGYTPQDKVFRRGEPLSSQVVIRMLESAGIDAFITVDLHSPLLLPMFKAELNNISAHEMFVDFLNGKIKDKENWVVVALDKGSLARNKQLAEALGIKLKQFDKKRDRYTGTIVIDTGDVQLPNKKVLTFDDYTSTGGTLVTAAELIRGLGAREFHCLVTHIVTPGVFDKIADSKVDNLVTTNSTLLLSEKASLNPRFHVLDIWEYLLAKI